jgi:glutamine synthetase
LKPKAILAYCREKGIRTIDLRFTDLNGTWQHLIFPVTAISEASFDEGFGQEVFLDLGFNRTENAEMIYSVIVPSSEANYLDCSTDPPTLVLVSAIQDAIHRQESAWDSRNVANQAVRFLESTSIADEVYVRNLMKFDMTSVSPPGTVSRPSSVSGFDEAFKFRCRLMNRAIDAGVKVERHFHHHSMGSSLVLQPTKVLESCDDVAMTRYLMSQLALEEGCALDLSSHLSSTQWKLFKNGEPILPGNSSRGISEVGRFAQGGIAQHSKTLSAIFLASVLENEALRFPFASNAAMDSPRSLSRSVQDSQSPRSRVIEVRGLPTEGNQYLACAAILMAMIDGILNKISSPAEGTTPNQILAPGSDVSDHAKSLAEALSSDLDFLLMGNVFTQELLDSLYSHLNRISSS